MESKATVLERGVRSKSPVSRNGAPSSMQVPQVSSPSTTPRPPDRPFSPPPPSSPRIREASEATITERSSRSRSSSASSSNADLRASIETLKTARAPETPFYAMPGTISIPKNLGSPGESLVRPFRQRAASSTDGRRSGQVGYHAQYATSPGGSNSVSTSPPVHSLVRGRAASSVFTGKGEIKPLKDFVVGEVVIDTRLYPQGYTVLVTSRLPKPPKRSENGETSAAERVKEICLEVEGQDKGKGREVPGKAVFLKLGSLKVDPALATATSTPTASLRAPSPISKSASSDSHKSTDSNVTMIVELPKPVEEPKEPLPISYTIYTMPSSPLHSSSLNPEGGTTRHLLRMTLPTAQYWSSSVRDPLTGQVRQGPKKPAWMKVLEGTLEEGDEAKEGSTEGPSMKRMKGYVVDIEVRPVIAEGAKGGDKDKKRKLRKVIVNGVTVSVVGERESLSSLGRDELLNEQVERMGILSRVPNETEVLPEELIHPIAIADDILDPSVWDGNTSTFGSSANSASLISNALDATSPDSLLHANDKSGQSGGNSAGEVTPGSAAGGLASSITSPSGNTSSSTSSGIWGSLWSYRFGFGGSTTASSDSKTRGLADEESPERPSGEIQEDSAEGDQSGATAPLDKAGEPLPEQQVEQALPARRAVLQQQYPFSTLLAVALIAFLIGSLLRSLLSPADFVYVAHEADEAERVKLSGGDGWREMKRLFELKYILGGWDLQVAAIRRHPL